MTIRTALMCTAFLMLAGCVTPQTTVHTGATRPGLTVIGAPAGSQLYVDGLAMGQATQFDGHPGVLAVLEGPHLVEVRAGSSTLASERIFVAAGETHAVHVLAGAP